MPVSVKANTKPTVGHFPVISVDKLVSVDTLPPEFRQLPRDGCKEHALAHWDFFRGLLEVDAARAGMWAVVVWDNARPG